MITAEDIFVPQETLALVFRDTALTNHMIRALRHHHVYNVPVRIISEDDPPEALPEVKPLLDEKLREEAVNGIRRMFDAVSEADSDENMTTAYQAVKELDAVVDQLVETLNSESGALVHISDLKSYDEYTYHHSLSVAVLSIAIGQKMSLGEDELKMIGRCAMMHDIGKMLIPPGIINKPSKLTDEEFALIKSHSALGYNYLQKGGIGDDRFRLGVLCHHEKINGRGYPGGLNSEKIPFLSRIISVADVYDAVTSYRSYRMPLAPAEALEIIMGDVGNAFDYDIVKAFIEKLELYPLNTCIELSDGRRAIVTDNANSMRPVVRIIKTGEELDLFDFKNLTLLISRVIDNA